MRTMLMGWYFSSARRSHTTGSGMSEIFYSGARLLVHMVSSICKGVVAMMVALPTAVGLTLSCILGPGVTQGSSYPLLGWAIVAGVAHETSAVDLLDLNACALKLCSSKPQLLIPCHLHAQYSPVISSICRRTGMCQ